MGRVRFPDLEDFQPIIAHSNQHWIRIHTRANLREQTPESRKTREPAQRVRASPYYFGLNRIWLAGSRGARHALRDLAQWSRPLGNEGQVRVQFAGEGAFRLLSKMPQICPKSVARRPKTPRRAHKSRVAAAAINHAILFPPGEAPLPGERRLSKGLGGRVSPPPWLTRGTFLHSS